MMMMMMMMIIIIIGNLKVPYDITVHVNYTL